MNRGTNWLVALAAVAAMAGCASGVKLDPPAAPVVERSAQAPLTPLAQPPITPRAGAGTGAGSGTGANSSANANPNASQSQVMPAAPVASASTAAGPVSVARLIQFDYDSFVIKPDFLTLIEAHGRFLKANPGRRISIEGHTDDRGGREYNLALGQKRAEAVRKALGLAGASDSQMEAVSFGKEKPANTAATEAAYAENRRAEIVYR